MAADRSNCSVKIHVTYKFHFSVRDSGKVSQVAVVSIHLFHGEIEVLIMFKYCMLAGINEILQQYLVKSQVLIS